VAGIRPTGWRAYDWVVDDYERLTPPLFGALARDLVVLLEPQPRGVVLDAGTGTGVAAEAAAAAMGGSGAVVGVDPSLPMLEAARRRARWLVAGVAPGLPFPDATFDVVVANLVLSHFRDTAEGAHELVRVLRPGGRLGASAWPEDRDEPESDGKEAGALIESSLEEAGLAKEPPAAEKPARGEAWLKQEANVRAVLTEAGLDELVVEERRYPQRLSAADYYGWRVWGGRGRYLRWVSDEATWQRFERDALAALERRFPDGIRSVSTARLAVGTKPQRD
jgi:SAM-dependent methyltransferase